MYRITITDTATGAVAVDEEREGFALISVDKWGGKRRITTHLREISTRAIADALSRKKVFMQIGAASIRLYYRDRLRALLGLEAHYMTLVEKSGTAPEAGGEDT